MTHSSDNPFDPSALFTSWMSSVTDLWSNMAQPKKAEPETDERHQNSDRNSDFIKAQMDAWQSIASAMGHPDTMTSLVQGAGSLPETLLKMTQPALTNINQMIQQLNSYTGKADEYLKTFSFSNMDTEAFNIWDKVYDNEFRKLLKIPQIGLAREYQEKINRFWDRFNILQSTVAEFLHFLYLPFEKSHTSFLKKITDLAKKNELPKDAKAYYQIWLKILEGHYMVLFQDPQYITSLSKTLTAVAAYDQAKKDLVDDLLRQFSIPSSAQLDSVYKDLYEIKKRLSNLEKILTNR